MINEKQCYQDAGSRKIREKDGVSWRGGEVRERHAPLLGKIPRNLHGASDLESLQGSMTRVSRPAAGKRRGLLRTFPPPASSWRP